MILYAHFDHISFCGNYGMEASGKRFVRWTQRGTGERRVERVTEPTRLRGGRRTGWCPPAGLH